MEGWKTATLQEICLRITDGAHNSPPSVSEGKPMGSVKDMTHYGINIETCRHISNESFEALVRQGCNPHMGDVLIAKDGATALDTVCEVRENVDLVLLSSIAILRPNPEKVTPSFLRNYLSCPTIRQYMKDAFTTGAAIPRVVLKDFKKVAIKLPSVRTQKKVCSVFSPYDDLIENNLRRIKILEEMAQALYREWFVKFRFPGHQKVKMVNSLLGKIPEGWEVKRLGDIAEDMRRGVKPSEVPPDTPYIGLEHLPRKSIALSDWGFAEDVESTKFEFKKGEILFGKIRPYFHKVGVAPMNGICSSDTIVIAEKDRRWYSLLLCCVSSEDFVAHATQTSKGTKMPRADWEVLTKYPIPVPPPSLLGKFNSFVGNNLGLIQNLIFKNRNLRKTRDLLLPKLISGELDVSELDITIPEANA